MHRHLRILTTLLLAIIVGRAVPANGQGAVKYNATTNALVAPTASQFRSANGLAIGTHVQAYDEDLTTYAGITPSANVQTLLGSADYAAFRTSLALVIGTNVQAWDADLDDLADGSLSGSKVGSGISASNVTTGTLPLAAGGTIYAARATNAAARTSTTTVTDDDVLTVSIPAAGTYLVITELHFLDESSNPGCRAKHAFSGTKNNIGGELSYGEFDFQRYTRFSPTPSSTYDEWAENAPTGTNISMFYRFLFEATSAGTLVVQWAQRTSHADDTILAAGSSITVQKLP